MSSLLLAKAAPPPHCKLACLSIPLPILQRKADSGHNRKEGHSEDKLLWRGEQVREVKHKARQAVFKCSDFMPARWRLRVCLSTSVPSI